MKHKKTDRVDIWIGAAIILGIIAFAVVHADLVYGDWTCAFARCVRVVR